MDKTQYNIMIDKINKKETAGNSLEVTRTIFNNMGVALPQGDYKQVCSILSTDDYMSWRQCTLEEAIESANNGVPTIAITENSIKIMTPSNGETDFDTIVSNDLESDTAVVQYYSYYNSSSTTSGWKCGGANYYHDVTQHSFILQSNGYYVCTKCGHQVKHPILQDKQILSTEDYYRVLACYLAIPYHSVNKKSSDLSLSVDALLKAIDDIRSKDQYASKYEYVDGTNKYKRTIPENMLIFPAASVSYNEITNTNILFHNGVASSIVKFFLGFFVPKQYATLFAALTANSVYDSIPTLFASICNQSGFREIALIMELILLGCSDDQTIAVTDKVIYVTGTTGLDSVKSKFVFTKDGKFKKQENSHSTTYIIV